MTYTYGRIFGGIPKMFVFWKFLKILMVSDKSIHKAFRIHKTLYNNPLKKTFIFTIYQNYTFGFKPSISFCRDTIIISWW